MNQTIDEAMRMLNTALGARKFYWSEHPAAISALASAMSLFATALAAQPVICIMGFRDRVIADNVELSCGAELCAGLFAVLRARGTESLTFQRGLALHELDLFLSEICLKDSTAPLRSSTCLRFGRIGQKTSTCSASGPAPCPEAPVAKLKSVWQGLVLKGIIDRELLDAAACNISSNLRYCADDDISLAVLQTHQDYTFVHTTNVAILSAAFGDSLGLSAPLVRDLTIAALLHDVGKRRVPKEVLNKNSSLSAGEFNVVARHPTDGAGMLFGIKELPAIVAIVAFEHHMHPDGSGYPRIKIGHQMQLASQIVQIADVFDALRSNRPYRAGLSFEDARLTMYKDVRRFYNPDLLDTFFANVAKRVIQTDAGPAPLIPPDSKAPQLILPQHSSAA